MSEIIVVGSFKARPGKEDEALDAFKELVGPTHREQGCILYALNQGVDDPHDLCFVERWASVEAHDAHMQAPHIKAIFERVPDLFGDDANVARYEERPAGEAKKGSLAVHAGAGA